jgi:hypothetical protein
MSAEDDKKPDSAEVDLEINSDIKVSNPKEADHVSKEEGTNHSKEDHKEKVDSSNGKSDVHNDHNEETKLNSHPTHENPASVVEVDPLTYKEAQPTEDSSSTKFGYPSLQESIKHVDEKNILSKIDQIPLAKEAQKRSRIGEASCKKCTIQ